MTKDFVAIIDYGSGNLRSAAKACEHVIVAENLDLEVKISANAEDIRAASHIILPGQGAFGDCMNGLQAVEGMISALEEKVLHGGTPFLGICVGMQLMASRGLEHGTHEGLGWIAGEVIAMRPQDPTLKIPHMGWNTVNFTHSATHPVLQHIKNGEHYYFVHSFMFQCEDKQHILGTTTYGENITAIVGRDNMLGVQFHPEKSQTAGLQLITEFLQWKP